MTDTGFRSLTAEEMRRAAAGVVPLPIEQTAVWEAFEASQGRTLWGRYAWEEDGRTCALVCLHETSLRGFTYLWARHGPVWLKEQSPQRAQRFRTDLAQLVRQRDRRVVFVRLHSTYSACDLREPIQGITYDRTVVIDTTGGTEESVLESMTTDGRRAVRRARKRMDEGGGRLLEETGLDREQFDEYYSVLVETATRDGFRPHPEQVYWDMMTTLGPEHARLFGIRVDGELVCWDMVVLNDRRAMTYYGASSARARSVLGPDALDFGVAVILAGEGIQGLDLMGAHSPRVPELYGLGRYKQRFARSFTDVDGAWDMPVHTGVYTLLVRALHAKHTGRSLGARLGADLRRLRGDHDRD
ncbi:GNAT family N-acetyltransferase [Actinomyces sp.]|uniref:lipid II:glycine glycyltransferase FemX n=1 Tax=Actinomyces sp. TaxID=29317 RepID=UPI00289EBD24|nr:GNAT family N-acetyltransferase [Actinomyces sp.]